jgi:hypothetical protein
MPGFNLAFGLGLLSLDHNFSLFNSLQRDSARIALPFFLESRALV